MKLLTCVALLLSLISFNVSALDPTEIKVKIYQVSVALNADCSSPQTIMSSASGIEADFLSNPILGSGTLGHGTYNCVMITMDDVIKFRPNGTDGSCSDGVEYAVDLCRERDMLAPVEQHYQSFTDLLEGTTFTSTECAGTDGAVSLGGVANKVTMFLRTGSMNMLNPESRYASSWQKGIAVAGTLDDGSSVLGPTVDELHGIELESPFVVNGAGAGTFYVDATGMVDGADATCKLTGAMFGFR